MLTKSNEMDGVSSIINIAYIHAEIVIKIINMSKRRIQRNAVPLRKRT